MQFVCETRHRRVQIASAEGVNKSYAWLHQVYGQNSEELKHFILGAEPKGREEKKGEDEEKKSIEQPLLDGDVHDDVVPDYGVKDGFRAVATNGPRIFCRNVSVQIQAELCGGPSACCKAGGKQLLHGVYCAFEPGRVTAGQSTEPFPSCLVCVFARRLWFSLDLFTASRFAVLV